MFFEVSGVLEALPAMFTLNSIFIAMDLKKKIKVMLLISASGALALMGVRVQCGCSPISGFKKN